MPCSTTHAHAVINKHIHAHVCTRSGLYLQVIGESSFESKGVAELVDRRSLVLALLHLYNGQAERFRGHHRLPVQQEAVWA